jgi:hypothetical protein
MTNLDDFDRSLSDFLADGPTTAPEAPVIAAMAHARTTPRRPDPLRRFRPDAMAGRRAGLVGSRPGLLLAVLTIAVASVGVAVVGSRPNDGVVPPPSDLASPSGTPSGAPFFAEIPIQVAAGNPLTATVTDTTGDLVGVVSSATGDSASVGNGSVSITGDPSDVNVLIATWSGGPCETRAAMIVDERTSTITVSHEICTGDLIAFDRTVRLTFRGQTDANAWRGSVPQDIVPGSSPGLPTDPTALHVELTGQCCGSPSIDIVDRSGHLTSAVAAPGAGAGESIAATNDDPRTVRVTWPGAPCDTVHLLTIAADFGLTIDRPICHGDAMLTMRALILTFDQDVDAGAMDTGLFDGRPDSGLPTWTATAPDSDGGRYDLTVADPGLVVESIEGSFDPEVESTGAGPTGIQLVRSSATTYRLIWLGQACAATPALSIDPSGDTWHLANGPCAAPPEVLRMVDVTLKQARAGDALPTVEAATTTP